MTASILAIAKEAQHQPETWLSKLPQHQRDEILEIRKQFHRGELPYSMTAIAEGVVRSIGDIVTATTVRRWLKNRH